MRIVGIGASAGGMEALITFLQYLPKDTGAAFILIQHLSPDHDSIMDEILSKYTQMPVIPVQDNLTPSPNKVYINVPRKDLTFQYGMLITEDRAPDKRLHLPIDDFFHSLGLSLEKEAISIIFSGSGTDGSRGCRTIKEKGGLIFVQDPNSATFDGMPQSVIKLEIADIIETPKKIAETLAEVLQQRKLEEAGERVWTLEERKNKDWFLKILDYVSSIVNVDFKEYREPTLVRRMDNRMLLQKIDNLEQYHEFLQGNEQEVSALCRDFFIGVTSFFRDKKAFESIEQKVIPKLVEQSAGQGLRLWVPACSTGEEAYTLTMLLDNYLKVNKIKCNFKIFASDVNPKAIRIAAQGLYPYNMLTDVPDHLLLQYFVKSTNNYRVKQEIRDKILFAVHNVLSDPPFIRMDFIACRNLLIYLKSATQRKLITTFHFSLNSNAYLFLGASETLGDLKNVFNKVSNKWNIFQKKKNSKSLPRSQRISSKGAGNLTEKLIVVQEPNSISDNPDLSDFLQEEVDAFTSYLATHFTPPCLYLNENLDILFANIDLEELLGVDLPFSEANLQDLFEEKRIHVFKEGVEKCMDSGEAFSFQDFSLRKEENNEIKANLKFQQVWLENAEQNVVLVEINLEQSTTEDNEQVYEELKKQKLFNQRRQQLELDLATSKQQTRELVQEQGETNHELQASNRELMASNEELQSTNEELQSVNEELYTVNNELQIKNDELNNANNDLNNILKSTEIGIIFLDNQLQIRRFTPAVRRQFSLMEDDVNRKITNFTHTLGEVNIGKICRQVRDTQEIYEEEVVNEEENTYLLRVLPYASPEENMEGLVIYFLNITELIRIRKITQDLVDKYQALFKYSEDKIIELSADGTIGNINKNFTQEQQNQKLSQQSIYDLVSKSNAQLIKKVLKEAINSKETKELERIEIQGEYYKCCVIPLQESMSSHEDGERVAIIIAQNITSEETSAAELELRIEEYMNFMDSLPFRVMLLEKSGKIASVNKFIYAETPKENFIGKNVTDFLNEEEGKKYLQSLSNIFDGMPFEEISFRYKNQGEDEKKHTMAVTPVFIDKNVHLAAVVSKEIFDGANEKK